MMIFEILSTIENEEQRNELSIFYEQHKKRLYSIALSKLHNEFDAEDAVQEVFAEIANNPDRFFEIPPDDRLAYTDIMLRNISVDIFKRKTKYQTEELDEDMEDVGVSLENAVFDEIEHDEIIDFVNDLPTMRRNVLMLHCFFDLPIKEIAQKLNIAPATASKHLTLAKKAVRKFVEERNERL